VCGIIGITGRDDAVAGIMAAIALGRLLGFVMDGFAGNNLPAFVAEIVFIAILATAYRQS